LPTILFTCLAGAAYAADGTTHILGVKKLALDATTDTVKEGYYASTTLHAIDPDLKAGNIALSTAIFGIAGTYAGHELPDTGQTSSYTGTFGEDHDYAPAATQPSYTADNVNFTVTDNRTGLMWKQCVEGQTASSGSCSAGPVAGTYTWAAATATCDGLEFAGYSDWRLPNIKELASIVKFQNTAPAIDTTYFPETTYSPAINGNYYWSSTTRVSYTPNKWVVSFTYGTVVDIGATFSRYVRCVRGP